MDRCYRILSSVLIVTGTVLFMWGLGVVTVSMDPTCFTHTDQSIAALTLLSCVIIVEAVTCGNGLLQLKRLVHPLQALEDWFQGNPAESNQRVLRATGILILSSLVISSCGFLTRYVVQYNPCHMDVLSLNIAFFSMAVVSLLTWVIWMMQLYLVGGWLFRGCTFRVV